MVTMNRIFISGNKRLIQMALQRINYFEYKKAAQIIGEAIILIL
jgi:hypothetical protein